MIRVNSCPISDCGKSIDPKMLMCKSHWFKVPQELRDRVWHTYRTQGVLSDEYWDAREAAIHSVEAHA